MWWDDYVVLVPIAFNFIGILLFWLQFKNLSMFFMLSVNHESIIDILKDSINWDTVEEDSNTFLFSWWFYYFTGYSILWYLIFFDDLSTYVSLTKFSVHPQGLSYIFVSITC